MTDSLNEAIDSAVDQVAAGETKPSSESAPQPGSSVSDGQAGDKGAAKAPGRAAATSSATKTPNTGKVSSTKPPAVAAGSAAQAPKPEQSAGTTQPPVAGAELDASKGEPPQERWPAILENARTKGAETATTELLGKLGLPSADPVYLDRAAEHLSQLSFDPVRYHRILGEALRAQGYQLPHEPAAGAAPAGKGGGAPDAGLADGLPEADYFIDGQPMYTGDKLLAVVRAEIKRDRADADKQWASRLEPLEQSRQQAELDSMRTAAWNEAAEELREARDNWPGFTELETQIVEAMRKDRRINMETAYSRVYRATQKDREAKLREDARKETIETIKQAPRVPTRKPGAPAARPSSGSGGRSIDQLFAEGIEHAMTPR